MNCSFMCPQHCSWWHGNRDAHRLRQSSLDTCKSTWLDSHKASNRRDGFENDICDVKTAREREIFRYALSRRKGDFESVLRPGDLWLRRIQRCGSVRFSAN